jgi:outer membrane protein OmpA-like peptidoglycan-associated protein
MSGKPESLHTDGASVDKPGELVTPDRLFAPRMPEVSDEALVPALERLIAMGASTRPGPLSDALSPVMGRSFVKGLFYILRRLVLALNHVFLYTVSLRGWRWRIEAYRSRKSFSQVVYEHSLVCRVRQVLLIHRGTGLLLQQAESDYNVVQDGDMVSSMLTAIQDFVHDSFHGGKHHRLDTVRVGGMTVWIEQGPQAILASVIDGRPYEELRATFRAVLSRIHTRFAPQLEAFDGQTAPFSAAQPLLEACLRTQTLNVRERILPITWAVIVALLALLGSWGIDRYRQHRRWNEYLVRLSAEPGLVVIEAGRSGRRFALSGLRDPLSVDPAEIARDCGFTADRIVSRWERYQALCPELNLIRARQMLDPPPTVVLEMNGGVLEAKGTAPASWIREAAVLARGVPGTTRFQTEHLTDSDHREDTRWQAYLRRLSGEPGLVVIESGKRGGQFYIIGLRDMYAANPLALLVEAGFVSNRVTSSWQPYEALHPDLILARAREVLAPPEGVRLRLEGSALVATGAAPHDWLSSASILARALQGIASLRTEGLVDVDLVEFQAVQRRIEGSVFRFLVGSPDLWPGQQRELAELVADLRLLQRTAIRLNRGFSVEIRGHTDATGDEGADRRNSAVFARRFYDILKEQSVDLRYFTPVPMGSAEPDIQGYRRGDRAKNCCVSFKITLHEG